MSAAHDHDRWADSLGPWMLGALLAILLGFGMASLSSIIKRDLSSMGK